MLKYNIKMTMVSKTGRLTVANKATCIPTVIHSPCVQTVLLYRLSKTWAVLFPDIPTTSGRSYYNRQHIQVAYYIR
jgi:hypothetical protein